MITRKSNRGVLFKNTEKQHPKQADWRGSLDVAGTEHWINAWLNTSKNGQKYLSLSVKPKTEAKTEAKPDFNDSIPW